MCTSCVPIADSSYRCLVQNVWGDTFKVVGSVKAIHEDASYYLAITECFGYYTLTDINTGYVTNGSYDLPNLIQKAIPWYELNALVSRNEEYRNYHIPALNPIGGRLIVDWQSRERERMADGTYKPMPNIGIKLDPAHFVHRSTDKGQNDYIAYTPSDAYGKQDRQTRLRLGRYLKKYFPDMSDVVVVEAVTRFKTALARESAPYELHFTTNRDMISEIFETSMYAAGSSYLSCMHGKFERWTHRPYHVYADSPDVAVAYLVKMGEIVARSVVATKTNQWVRTYSIQSGDSKYCDVLEEMLEAAGYSEGDLEGCLITKLPSDRVIAPYIDGAARYLTHHNATTWRVSDSGDYCCDNTNGYAAGEDLCPRCENAEDDCSCIYCDCCEEYFAEGCDSCSMCEECERCISHEHCNCDRCSDCNEIISPTGRYTTRCRCTRCTDCNELMDDCECDRCDVCEELEADCECEKESESDESIDITPDVTIPETSMVAY